jgi:hypothetical protein
MDNGYVSYDILKDRVKHGDIVSLHNWNPDWPNKKLLIVRDETDETNAIRCVHLEMPIANLNIRSKWNEICERSAQPVSTDGTHITYNCFKNTYHRTTCLFATVRSDLLSAVMENGIGRIDNQEQVAVALKRAGNKKVRIPTAADVDQYMTEVQSAIGSEVAFDPVFANNEHWVTMTRYNAAWSKQVDDIISNEGVWKFISLVVTGGTAAVSHFFRTIGDYRTTPLGRQSVALVNTVLPAVDTFIAEMTTMRSAFQLTTTSFRAICATGGAIGIIMSVLMWFWASLKDIVTSPKEKIITTGVELREAYEGIDHWPVVCNVGVMAGSLVPKVWNMFVNWLLNMAAKILIALEDHVRRIQSS